MTQQSVLVCLQELADKGAAMDLQLDKENKVVFLSVPEEHRDYVLYKGVETDGDWSVEKTFDLETGMCTLTRVWLTPQESMEKKIRDRK